MSTGIMDLLGKERLIADGGMGALLQSMGLSGGEFPDLWNLSHPDRIRSVHESYIRAGANLITSNTFNSNPVHLAGKADASALVKAAIENAIAAREAAAADHPVFIGLDVGSTGQLLKPFGALSFEDAVESFAEVVRAGAAAGADYVMIETMSDIYECKAAVIAAKENCSLPVFLTVIFDGSGRLLTGADPETVVTVLEGLGVDALGVNCGLGPDQLAPIAEKITKIACVPVIVNPNAGLPIVENGVTTYPMTPPLFAEAMKKIAATPAAVLGGCCGTDPACIKELAETCAAIPYTPAVTPKFVEPKITSYTRTLSAADPDSLEYDSSLCASDNDEIKEAVLDQDADEIMNYGMDADEEEPDVIRIDLSLPGEDTASVTAEAVIALQSVIQTPLSISARDLPSLAAGLRVYNGIPMIHDVSGEDFEEVEALAAKYGAVIYEGEVD